MTNGIGSLGSRATSQSSSKLLQKIDRKLKKLDAREQKLIERSNAKLDRVSLRREHAVERGFGEHRLSRLDQRESKIESRLERKLQSLEERRNALLEMKSRIRGGGDESEPGEGSGGSGETEPSVGGDDTVGINPVSDPFEIGGDDLELGGDTPGDVVGTNPIGTPVDLPSIPSVGDPSDEAPGRSVGRNFRGRFGFDNALGDLGKSLRLRSELTESAKENVEEQIKIAKEVKRLDRRGLTDRADKGREELTDLIIEQNDIENQLRGLNGDEQVELNTDFVEKLQTSEGLDEIISEKSNTLRDIEASTTEVDRTLERVNRQIAKDRRIVLLSRKEEKARSEELSKVDTELQVLTQSLAQTADALATQLKGDIESSPNSSEFGSALEAHSGLESDSARTLLVG